MGRNKIVGEKIKTLRESKNVTQEELAEKTGLELDLIKEIETNLDLPSLAPLIKISGVLGVRLGTLLDNEDEIGPVVCRNNQHEEGLSFSSNSLHPRKNMDYYSLSKSKSGRHMEPFMIKIDPSSEVDFVLSSHEGEEFILVLDGTAEIDYGNENYILNSGDSIYYDAIIPHHVHAGQGKGARILAVIYTPV